MRARYDLLAADRAHHSRQAGCSIITPPPPTCFNVQLRSLLLINVALISDIFDKEEHANMIMMTEEWHLWNSLVTYGRQFHITCNMITHVHVKLTPNQTHFLVEPKSIPFGQINYLI